MSESIVITCPSCSMKSEHIVSDNKRIKELEVENKLVVQDMLLYQGQRDSYKAQLDEVRGLRRYKVTHALLPQVGEHIDTPIKYRWERDDDGTGRWIDANELQQTLESE